MWTYVALDTILTINNSGFGTTPLGHIFQFKITLRFERNSRARFGKRCRITRLNNLFFYISSPIPSVEDTPQRLKINIENTKKYWYSRV
jgi:hypothetical protein